jgi:predicted metal-dependent hydrolase
MVLPKELLSVADLGLHLCDDQWASLAREELASILDAGIRFESVLMAGFGLMLAWQKDLIDPRVNYVLHEIGEETRHSRLFIRVIDQLSPKAVNPFTQGIYSRVDRFITSRAITRKALFCVLVLTGEEVPDLIQKRSSEHPDTDPYVREVNRYHRMEEARHLAFARALLPEVWNEASVAERFVIRHFGPAIMTGVFDSLIHPGVYRTVGLPGWRTWNKVRKTPARRALRTESFRPVCEALRTAGAFGKNRRLPRAWRVIDQSEPARAS